MTDHVYDNSAEPTIKLDIKWEGTAPGLADHRLSAASFAQALNVLLIAARRKANNMLREAADRKETDVDRLAAEADRIDIQIASIEEGSTAPSCVVSVASPPPGMQYGLWPEGLAEDAIDRLLLDIESEARGIQRNTKIRDYFRQLPVGLTGHHYTLRVNGEIKREVHLGAIAIASDLTENPLLLEITGNVVGVGFDPDKHFVRVKGSDPSGSETTLSATGAQVDQALEIREARVRVLAVSSSGGKKLLRIQLAREPSVQLDVDSFVFGKWRNLLERLAQ